MLDLNKIFMDLVECQPHEIKDIPRDRTGAAPTYSPPKLAYTPPKQVQGTNGDWVLFFGKHLGKRLREVPRSYLEWMTSVEGATENFRKAQRAAMNFLASTQHNKRKNNRPRRRTAAQPPSAPAMRQRVLPGLDREFLDIVRTAPDRQPASVH